MTSHPTTEGTERDMAKPSIFSPGWMKGFRAQKTTPVLRRPTDPAAVFGTPEHTANQPPVVGTLDVVPPLTDNDD